MTDDILFEKHGTTGVVTLNRPASLNALTLPMVCALNERLQVWNLDESV